VFVRLDETIAEGLVPARTLDEPFTYDPARQLLLGRRSGTALALGDRVAVALIEADVLTGQLTFRLLDHTPGAAARAAGRSRPKGRTRRQPRQ
jgi:ribonuclease R